MRDFSQFTPPNFSHRVSLLPKGVVLVDLEPDILIIEVQILNSDVEDVLTRGIMSSSHCINTPLPPGTFFRSLIAKFLLMFDGGKWHYGLHYF